MPWKYLSRVQPAVINNLSMISLTNVWYTYGMSIYISGATVYSSLLVFILYSYWLESYETKTNKILSNRIKIYLLNIIL